MAWRLDFGHHEDVSIGSVGDNSRHILSTIEPTPLHLDFVAEILSESAALGEFGVRRNLDAPRLIIGQMPVKDIEFMERSEVDEFFDEFDAEKIPGAVEHDTAP